MKKFELVNLLKNEYKCLVLAISYENPFEDLEIIEKELLEKGYEGYILFDMLGYIGDNSERFIKGFFDGDSFDDTSFEVVKINKPNMIRDITKNYFLDFKELLDETILTSIQKKLILKGITI